MSSLDPSERASVLFGGIKCDTFAQVIAAVDSFRPALSPILKEVYPTADSFLRTGYFGGPPTVPWIDWVDDVFDGFNESGMNLLGNLRAMKAAKQKKPEMDKEVEFIVTREHDDELEGWKAAFSDYYIDPYGCVDDLAETLRNNITDFCARPGHYIAPYTCIVTSSMMGKSRLVKEVATLIPTVYMCLGTNRTFYPHPTKIVVEWIRGGVEGMGYWHPSDKDFLVPTLKYSAFLLALIQKLAILVSQHNDEKEYSWMWKFFAEPPKDCKEINAFWTAVTDQATIILRANSFSTDESSQTLSPWKFSTPQKRSSPGKFSTPPKDVSPGIFCTPQKRSSPGKFTTPQKSSSPAWPSSPQTPSKVPKSTVSAEAARKYLAVTFGDQLRDAYSELKTAFNVVADRDFNLLLIFDEARYLTDTSAIDGKRIPAGVEVEDECDMQREQKPSDPNAVTEYFPFSNFRALRRALHLLMQTRVSPESLNIPVPRIFGLMTDTSSRLTNFQPALWEDNSLKINQLPSMGWAQFDPIFNFTSIDVHSRMSNMCVSDVNEVARVERLLKFGRPGWWAIYHHYPKKNMLELAAAKLTCMQHPSDRLFGTLLRPVVDDKTKLRLFAILAPRLGITAGPYTREAAETVASHLAIVVNADHHGHFLKTVYPSEPIVAAAAASLTERPTGWPNTLSALTSYIQTGIVDAGFRGELLTKILCLMAVDESMSQVVHQSSRESYWKYALPVKVSVFLDHLITAPPNFNSFSEAIRATPIHDERLNRFLDGHIFFNHFIRMEEKLTLPLIVQAWNRGAALMCKNNTPLIDHVIPVMLASTHGSPPNFGPLYDDWTEEQVEEARQHVSYIVINSRNYTDPRNWTATYITANNSNITECESTLGAANNKLWMTIMQEYGPRQRDEEHITIFPSRGSKKPLEDTTQLHVILKELGDQTYTAFQKSYIHPLAQLYLQNLCVASGNYHDGIDNKPNSIRRDNIPVMLGDYTTKSKETWRMFRQNSMQVDE